jgi:hypothetical protein
MPNGKMTVHDELERVWKEKYWYILRYFPSVYGT